MSRLALRHAHQLSRVMANHDCSAAQAPIDEGPARVRRPPVMSISCSPYEQRLGLQVIGFDVELEPPAPVAVSVTV